MPAIKKIVLDTNFLLVPGQFGIDIFAEIERICTFPYQLYIVDGTIDELEKISRKGKPIDKKAVQIAKELCKEKSVGTIITRGDYVDDTLVELSGQDEFLIATNDSGLRKRLKKGIFLRQKKYLQMI